MSTKRTLTFLSILVWGVGLAAQDDPYRADLETAERHLRRGELSRAEFLFDEVLADWEDFGGPPDGPTRAVADACRRGLLSIELRRGRYAEVLERISALDAGARSDRDLLRLEVDALRALGRLDDAEARLRERLTLDADDLAARVALAEVLDYTGRRADAEQAFRYVVDASQRLPVRDPATLTVVARAHAALGAPLDLQRASVLLAEAIRTDGQAAAPRILLAELRFRVYAEWSGADSAEDLLTDVLADHGDVPDALVLLYRTRRANHLLDPAKTQDYLDRALAANPRHVPALIERGVAMVDDRRFAEGAQVLDEALAVNPRDKEALAQRAAVAYLTGEPEVAAALRERALAVDPTYAGLDAAIGDRMVALYRFADAVPYYERALERRADSVEALEGLARAKVYSGEGEAAAALLRRAKELEPGFVDPWRNNVLAVQDLLEEEYRRVEREGFVFFLHRDDAAVLERYLVPYHEEARRVLGAKYGVTPERPTRVEVLHTWDDFSVRTIGFRGFTALGACFGPMITLVSPVDGDLRRNDFMWTATVWHEYAHVMTLALSKSRVPRWLTEGCSVYEEGARDPSWERGMARDLLDAWHNGQIPPVRLMNQLFRGPRILFGYYLGGEVVAFLTETQGFEAVQRMLIAYGEDKSTTEVLRAATGGDPAGFDRAFREWLWRERIAGLSIVPRYDDATVERKLSAVRAAPDDLDARIALAWAALQRGVQVDAAAQLQEILRRDPDHPEAQLVRAELLRRDGRLDEARALFAKGFAAGADDFDSRLRCAQLLLELGDEAGAVEQLERAKRCWPDCTEQQSAPELRLARIHREAGRTREAMEELATYCARTARAYAPRIELARYAREAGDRAREAELLEQVVAIDPFVRAVHLDLARCYVSVGRLVDAVREFEVALVVQPSLDRDLAAMPAEQRPRVDSPEWRGAQASIRVELAKVLRELGRDTAARQELEKAIQDAPDSDAAMAAQKLLDG